MSESETWSEYSRMRRQRVTGGTGPSFEIWWVTVFWEVVMLSKYSTEGGCQVESTWGRGRQWEVVSAKAQGQLSAHRWIRKRHCFFWADACSEGGWQITGCVSDLSGPSARPLCRGQPVQSHIKPVLVKHAWDLEEQQEGCSSWSGEKIKRERLVASNLSPKTLVI